jgi:hypothetical protein
LADYWVVSVAFVYSSFRILEIFNFFTSFSSLTNLSLQARTFTSTRVIPSCKHVAKPSPFALHCVQPNARRMLTCTRCSSGRWWMRLVSSR